MYSYLYVDTREQIFFNVSQGCVFNLSRIGLLAEIIASIVFIYSKYRVCDCNMRK